MIDPDRQEEIYASLNQAWRYEISIKPISNIKGKDNFEKDVRSLVTVLENQIANPKQDIARQIYKKTLKNVVYMLDDLMELRAAKILSSTKNLKKLNEEFLFPVEIEYYRQLYTAFRGYSKTKNLLMNGNGHSTVPHEKSAGNTVQNVTSHTETRASTDTSAEKSAGNSQINHIEPTKVPKQVGEPLKSDPSESEEEFPDWQELAVQDQSNDSMPDPSKNLVESPVSESLPQETNKISKKKGVSKKIQKKDRSSKKKSSKKASDVLITVRILKGVPALVDEHLRVYGPFNSGDLAHLPLKNAEVLIDEHLAEEIGSN